jgi:predicted ATP-grasp superfamily ATP-dependent carboligase
MKQTTIATIQKCISSEEWEKLRNFSQEDLIHVAETIYNSNDKDFHEAAALLR